MPFTEQQKFDILNQLNFALTRDPGWDGKYLEETDIFDRLTALENKSSIQVAQAQSILAELLALEAKIAKELGSSNHGMIKADVVLWDLDAKTAGMESQRSELIKRLRYLLGMSPTAADPGSGTGASTWGTILERS